MKWRKFSVKLPEYKKKIFVRMHDSMWVGVLFKDSDDGFKGNILTLRGALQDVTGEHIDYYEWLDEFLPASIEDEAVGLYPDADENVTVSMGHNGVQDLRRHAHITAARMYLSRLAEMGELLMTKDGEIEGLKNDVVGLKQNLEAAKLALSQIFGGTSFPQSIAQNALRKLEKHNL